MRKCCQISAICIHANIKNAHHYCNDTVHYLLYKLEDGTGSRFTDRISLRYSSRHLKDPGKIETVWIRNHPRLTLCTMDQGSHHKSFNLGHRFSSKYTMLSMTAHLDGKKFNLGSCRVYAVCCAIVMIRCSYVGTIDAKQSITLGISLPAC
jgi:hypothetical protein